MSSKLNSAVVNKVAGYYNNKKDCKIYNESIDLEEACGPNDIVIKIKTASLNPVDLLLYSLSHSIISKNSKLKVLGLDYAGEIVKIGSNRSNNWTLGEYVQGVLTPDPTTKIPTGTLASYLIINPEKQRGIYKMANFPHVKDLSVNQWALAASWPLVFQTAYMMLYNHGQVPATLKKGASILVIGAATSVGDAIVQIAKNELGISKVVGICSQNSIDDRKNAINPLFDDLIPYNDPNADVKEHVIKYVKQYGKFDLIADCVGSAAVVDIPSEVLRDHKSSHYATIVGDSKFNYLNVSIFQTLSQWRILWRIATRRRILNNYTYSLDMLKPKQDAMRLATKLIESGKYCPRIDSTYKLEEFQAAIERLGSSKSKGKVAIIIEEDLK